MKNEEKTKYKQSIGIINKLISGCVDSKGLFLECEPKNVSKIVFERYSNAIKGKLKVFMYTVGKESNNHPYTYNKDITRNQFVMIDDSFVCIRDYGIGEGLDDLFSEPYVDIMDSLKCGDCNKSGKECTCD